jgi:hypothetical protein
LEAIYIPSQEGKVSEPLIFYKRKDHEEKEEEEEEDGFVIKSGQEKILLQCDGLKGHNFSHFLVSFIILVFSVVKAKYKFLKLLH